MIKVTPELIDQLYRMINTEQSRRGYVYVPPLDIEKSITAFLRWLEENGYTIVRKDKGVE